MPGTHRQNSMFKKTKGFVQKNNPFPVTSCGRRRTLMMTDSPVNLNEDSPLEKRKKRKKSNEPRKTTKGKGRNFRTVKEGAGMTVKGVR